MVRSDILSCGFNPCPKVSLSFRSTSQSVKNVTGVDYLREETVRAARVLRQLLAFTRQKAGDPKCIDLHTIVDKMHPMLKALCGGNIAFSAELTPGVEAVVVDPGNVEQIILNLALNARDAMPQGGKLVIRTENVHLTEADTHDHAALKPR